MTIENNSVLEGTKSNRGKTEQCWRDPRFVTFMFLPLGALLWAICAIVFPIFALNYVLKNNASDANKMATAIILMFFFLVCVYYCIGFYQAFFVELRKKFIARNVAYHEGEFILCGYYFKQDRFKASDVVTVEPHVISERWFGKEMGTLLSRSTRFTIPSGKNINWKISLRDGRVIYLAGEMTRVIELKALLEKCAHEEWEKGLGSIKQHNE